MRNIVPLFARNAVIPEIIASKNGHPHPPSPICLIAIYLATSRIVGKLKSSALRGS